MRESLAKAGCVRIAQSAYRRVVVKHRSKAEVPVHAGVYSGPGTVGMSSTIWISGNCDAPCDLLLSNEGGPHAHAHLSRHACLRPRSDPGPCSGKEREAGHQQAVSKSGCRRVPEEVRG